MNKPILLLVILSTLVTGCYTAHVKSSKINSSAFPSDFNDPFQVLLVDAGHNRGMNKMFNKRYDGKFEVVTQKDIETQSKFSDRNKYRYVLRDKSSGGSSSYRVGNDIRYTSNYVRDYYFYDLKTNKEYPLMGARSNGSFWATRKAIYIMNGRIKK